MTTFPLSPKLLEILSSRICHDLIGPISAVNNGVEFWQEMGADSGDDAINLIGHSATQASHKLQTFRLAYASGGSETHISLDDIKASFEKYSSEVRAETDWTLPPHAYKGILPKGFCKIVLMVLMIGIDMLPKGGTIRVTDEGTHDSPSIKISFISKDLNINIDYKDTLEGKVKPEQLSPRTIHPYLTMLFAEAFNIKVSILPDADGLSFLLTY